MRHWVFRKETQATIYISGLFIKYLKFKRYVEIKIKMYPMKIYKKNQNSSNERDIFSCLGFFSGGFSTLKALRAEPVTSIQFIEAS